MAYRSNRQWLVICAVLLSLAGLLAIDLYRRHEEVSLQEQQRLVSLASAINVNMAEQLRASSRMGMPLVRKMEPGLWEIRCDIADGISRVLFTVKGGQMVLLHGFVKKNQKTPDNELKTARNRLKKL